MSKHTHISHLATSILHEVLAEGAGIQNIVILAKNYSALVLLSMIMRALLEGSSLPDRACKEIAFFSFIHPD